MSRKKSMTGRRLAVLLLAYVMFCVSGGIVASGFLLPAVFGANATAKALVPSLKTEGIDFSIADLPQQSRLVASDGKTVIATFYTQNRIVVPLKDVSGYMQKAVVAREDRRFFEHAGVDVQGVMRAFIQTYVKKGSTQGGSSLTQQYVKNVLMSKAEEDDDPIAVYHAQEETIARKLREMLIAVQMEKQYTKPEILQGYLNIAQFGNGIYGVESAARRYFNKHAKDLNVVEAATIAAITKNPSSYDPSVTANQAESQRQRNVVLDLMLQEGYISQAQHDEAKAIPIARTLHIQSVAQGCQAAGDAAFFCSYVTKQIENSPVFGKTQEERDKLLEKGGLTIYTTMNVHANKAAMNAARAAVPVNDPSGLEATIAAIKPGTGQILGFGLNRTYDATESSSGGTRTAINYAVDQRDGGGQGFNVGSTWKPINMTAWMRAGKSINQVISVPRSFNLSSFPGFKGPNQWYSPQNSGGVIVTAESPLQGLVGSHNTTQLAMAQQIGLRLIAQTAKDLGYHNSPEGAENVFSSNSYNVPMVIGAVQASPLTMANVYATLAANGRECTPTAIKRVVDANGGSLKVPDANCHQVIDPKIAQTVAYAMNQGVARPEGAAHAAQLDKGRKTFAKTGTNDNYVMLTGGFVPQVAAFVAVANAEQPISFDNMTINGVFHDTWFGSYIATPAWKQFMNTYLSSAGIKADNNYGNPATQYM